MKIGVQLFTLRSLLEDDLWGTLEKLAEMGYRNVELAGLYDISAETWRDKLNGFGMQAVAAHVGLDGLEGGFDQTVADAKTLGLRWVVLPWVGEADYVSGWSALGQRLNEIGLRLGDHDLEFAYHNHSFELIQAQGKLGLDHIWDSSSGVNVQAELDVYWLQHGDVEPDSYILKLASRVPLIHAKDMAEGEDRTYTEVGQGILEWEDILEACRIAGVEYAIVEHDDPQIDPLESVRISREFLRDQGLED